MSARPEGAGAERCCDKYGEQPVFDEDAARDLPADEIRRRWPRITSQCLECGAMTIRYASCAHFIMGDW